MSSETLIPITLTQRQVIDSCDPEIRSLVELLMGLGYSTSDSGDGVSKLNLDADMLGFPHVIVMTLPDLMSAESERLKARCSLHGMEVEVQAMYSTEDQTAILMVMS